MNLENPKEQHEFELLLQAHLYMPPTFIYICVFTVSRRIENALVYFFKVV